MLIICSILFFLQNHLPRSLSGPHNAPFPSECSLSVALVAVSNHLGRMQFEHNLDNEDVFGSVFKCWGDGCIFKPYPHIK